MAELQSEQKRMNIIYIHFWLGCTTMFYAYVNAPMHQIGDPLPKALVYELAE